jgi:nucleoside-diphosphate-sugar epimerase
VFPLALKGQPAQVFGDIAQPHSFAYMPDFARALLDVASAEDALGQIWHIPHAPALPIRDVLAQVYELAGQPLKVQVMPRWVVKALGLVMPIMRELDEMYFQWDRPYRVDDTKFTQRFGWPATPLADGLARTLDWYRARPAQR